MDWLAKFLNLPEHFQHAVAGPGGGVLQGSASEAVLIAVLAAREQTVANMKISHPELTEGEVRAKLVAYSSDQSNSCIEKAGLLAAVPIRLLPAGDDLILRGDILEKAMDEDIAKGLIPIVCIATTGTTGTCAFDDLVSLGEVCNRRKIWLHVDAAYAGGAFALEEYADLRQGLELVDSINFNLHKMLKVNFDCCGMWLKEANLVADNFNVDRIYLKHKYEGQSQIPDFRHWQIPLGRRFRSLKVWITLRSFGTEGLRAHLRHHVNLAKRFESYILNDSRFELVMPAALGLVCFRPRGDDQLTSDLLHKLTESRKIYLVQATYKGRKFLRFVVCGMEPKESDIDFAWQEINKQYQLILEPTVQQLPAIEESSAYHAKTDIDVISRKLSVDLHVLHHDTDPEKVK